MTEMNVNIERLSPMRVAQVRIQSASPEQEALDTIRTWAKKQGVLQSNRAYRLFGYDNCLPDPDHIYTVWMTVAPDVPPEGDIQIKDVPGGLYAVLPVTGVEQIGPGWEQIVAWSKAHGYKPSSRQSLEEHLSPPDTPFDALRINLCLALEE